MYKIYVFILFYFFEKFIFIFLKNDDKYYIK